MLKGLISGLLMLVSLISVAQDVPENMATQKALVTLLQQGGYNIYIRHAATSTEVMDHRPVVLSDCKGQRNLSVKGRQDAAALGQAFTRLDIRVGQVLTSPFCRCKDTAQLAFGRFDIEQRLLFSFGLNKEQRIQASRYLATELARTPEAGTNTVLVSHSANLDGAAGVWPVIEGGVYIFRPQPEGAVEYLGMIPPVLWPTL